MTATSPPATPPHSPTASSRPGRRLCYSTADIPKKVGIGLVTQLSTVGSGTISGQVATGPWQLDVFGVDGLPPATLDGWGEPIASRSGEAGDTFEADVAGKLYVLTMFRSIGEDTGCPSGLSYRGRIDTLTFVS